MPPHTRVSGMRDDDHAAKARASTCLVAACAYASWHGMARVVSCSALTHLCMLRHRRHTMGHICYFVEDGDQRAVFTGDTLVGRHPTPCTIHPCCVCASAFISPIQSPPHLNFVHTNVFDSSLEVRGSSSKARPRTCMGRCTPSLPLCRRTHGSTAATRCVCSGVLLSLVCLSEHQPKWCVADSRWQCGLTLPVAYSTVHRGKLPLRRINRARERRAEARIG